MTTMFSISSSQLVLERKIEVYAGSYILEHELASICRLVLLQAHHVQVTKVNPNRVAQVLVQVTSNLR